jgi:hypothetical protein
MGTRTDSAPSRILAIVIAGVAVIVTAVVSFGQPTSASGETAILGMPFSGRWAYNVDTLAACGPNPGQTSHPTCHEIFSGSDWSTDLYAPDGANVNLRLSTSFTPNFVFVPTVDGSCGHRVVFKIRNGNTDIAKIYFDHLKNEVNSTAEIAIGRPVGQVDQTCHVGFSHTHLEVKSLTGGYGCYTNYTTASETAGFNLNEGDSLGNLVSGASGIRQACTNSGTPSFPDAGIAGNWDGVGGDTVVAVARTSSGLLWYLRNYNTGGTPSYSTFYYGSSDWTPVVGDWDGNGTVTIGVVARTPNGMQWYLRNNNSGGPPDVAPFYYGAPDSGWTPVVGNWDGVGGDTIGAVARTPNGMQWYLRNNNSGGPPDVAPFYYGAPDSGWTP